MASAMLKIPKSLGAVVDLYYLTREKRLALDRAAAEMKTQEGALGTHLINSLPKSDATGIAGKLARATIVTKSTATLADWAKLRVYIKKHDALDLLQHRLSQEAVHERWRAGKAIAGIERFNVVSISLSKLK